MEKKKMQTKLPALLLLLILIFTDPGKRVGAQNLCYSQFMLANEACSFVRQGGVAEAAAGDQQPGDDSSNDSACCRRLAGIDNSCICGLLARMPRFVTRPQHVITLSPERGCDVSFQCDGRP